MADLFVELVERVAELERRFENTYRKVRVKERKDGKLILEDDTGFVSAPVSQASLSAGGWKIDAPADVGVQGLLLSDGDPANATFLPTLPSNDHPAASDEPSTLRLKGPGGEVITIANGTLTAEVEHIDLGGEGGKKVARVGDMVEVGSGSSAGLWPIVEGSSVVSAVD